MRRNVVCGRRGIREDRTVKVEIYNAIMQRQKMSRRRMLQGAASVAAIPAYRVGADLLATKGTSLQH